MTAARHASPWTQTRFLVAAIAFTLAAVATSTLRGGGIIPPLLGGAGAVIQGWLLIRSLGRGRLREEVEKQFFDYSRDAYFVLDGPRIVDCNQAMVSMLGAADRDHVLRLTPPDISPELQPDGRPSGDKALEMIGRALKDGFNRFEWVHKRLNGETFPVSVTLVCAPILGKDHLLVFWHDIGELVAAREHDKRNAIDRHEERQNLAASFEARIKNIVTSLVQSASQMQTNARSLSVAAEHSNQGLAAVSSATLEAKSCVETVAAAGTQLSASIQEIARRVAQSAAITREAAQDAKVTNETITGLADAAKKIGEIVGLINAVASQTNLLALNATIESARAGEAGKGFAVVANEVKGLAGQTARATDEISRQITAIQHQTRASVEAIRHIGDTILRIDEMMAAVTTAIADQEAATAEIARNVDTAAHSTRQVSDNLGDVAGSAQTADRIAQNVLSGTANLTSGSSKLEQEVQDFLAEIRAR